MEKILKELLDKINYLMSKTYLMIDDKVVSVMDLYQQESNLDRQPKSILQPTEEQIKEVIEYAQKTKNFKIEGSCIVVEYKEGIYHIPKSQLNE